MARTKTTPEPSVEVRVKRLLTSPAEPPVAVHHFAWTRIGNEVVIEMGFFDFPVLRNDIEAAKKAGSELSEMTFNVSHRFGMSLDKFKAIVHDAAALLPKDEKVPS